MGKGFLKRKEALSRKIGLGCVVILVLTLLRYRIIHPFDDPSIRLRPFHLYRLGLISESDFSLFMVTDDIEEAMISMGSSIFPVVHVIGYLMKTGRLVRSLLNT